MPTAQADPSEPAPTLAGDVDLKSLIPAEIGGNTMVIEGGSPDSFLLLWNDEQRARDLLTSLGKSVSDVSIANSYGDEAEYPQGIFVYAYRVAGADGDALLRAMVDEYLRVLPGFVETPATMGGKDVIALAPPDAPASARQYFYGIGDIVLNVNGNPEEWVIEALTKLP